MTDVSLSSNELILGREIDGKAFIFSNNGSRWALSATLTSQLTGTYSFGDSVAIAGGLAVVGSYR